MEPAAAGSQMSLLCPAVPNRHFRDALHEVKVAYVGVFLSGSLKRSGLDLEKEYVSAYAPGGQEAVPFGILCGNVRDCARRLVGLHNMQSRRN